jgi:hypothetical protein
VVPKVRLVQKEGSMSHRVSLTLIGLLAIIANPASANSQGILTMNGLGEVHFGMTMDATERALNARLTQPDHTPESKSCWVHTRADGSDPGTGYMIENGHLTRIEINTPSRVLTEKRIGVGSSIASLREAYGHSLFVEQNVDGDRFVLNAPSHRRAIIFETDGHSVVTFRAGEYPSVAYDEDCQ